MQSTIGRLEKKIGVATHRQSAWVLQSPETIVKPFKYSPKCSNETRVKFISIPMRGALSRHTCMHDKTPEQPSWFMVICTKSFSPNTREQLLNIIQSSSAQSAPLIKTADTMNWITDLSSAHAEDVTYVYFASYVIYRWVGFCPT